MGWGYGVNALGREIGYNVAALCDESSCKAEIDRGLSSVCGGMHDGGDYGCGGYFCGDHLYYRRVRRAMLCEMCVVGSKKGLPFIRRLLVYESRATK